MAEIMADSLDPPSREQGQQTIVTVRREVGNLFRALCDQSGVASNECLSELIAIWNARGRPDVTELARQVDAGWEDGKSRFRIHRSFAAMGRTWARERGKPYYAIFEGIMLEWAEEQNDAW